MNPLKEAVWRRKFEEKCSAYQPKAEKIAYEQGIEAGNDYFDKTIDYWFDPNVIGDVASYEIETAKDLYRAADSIADYSIDTNSRSFDELLKPGLEEVLDTIADKTQEYDPDDVARDCVADELIYEDDVKSAYEAGWLAAYMSDARSNLAYWILDLMVGQELITEKKSAQLLDDYYKVEVQEAKRRSR